MRIPLMSFTNLQEMERGRADGTKELQVEDGGASSYAVTIYLCNAGDQTIQTERDIHAQICHFEKDSPQIQ